MQSAVLFAMQTYQRSGGALHWAPATSGINEPFHENAVENVCGFDALVDQHERGADRAIGRETCSREGSQRYEQNEQLPWMFMDAREGIIRLPPRIARFNKRTGCSWDRRIETPGSSRTFRRDG